MIEWLTGTFGTPIQDAIQREDLDGYIAVLILHSSFSASAESTILTSPWAGAAKRLLASQTIPGGPLRRTHDVAVLGVRLALGGDRHLALDFAGLARRELAREPLPPAACVRDDERILLGIAAGIGAAAPDLAQDIKELVRAHELTTTVRQACLDRWAEALAAGESRLSQDIARRAYACLTPPASAGTMSEGDSIAATWLATRLLDAAWQPSDPELRRLDEIISDGTRLARTIAIAGAPVTPLDAALLLDALSVSPQGRLARNNAVQSVLAVIDAFPKSAAVLSKRKRERPPFTIRDEYDVQDLFHSLVQSVVPDIVEEDPAPKVAGHSARLDFTSKATKMGFEMKHVKDANHAKKVREEILLDERTYQEHPYVETVIAFVSDPERHIPLPERTAFESDLSQSVTIGGRSVRYIVRVR